MNCLVESEFELCNEAALAGRFYLFVGIRKEKWKGAFRIAFVHAAPSFWRKDRWRSGSMDGCMVQGLHYIASQDLSCRPGYLDGSLYASNATPASASDSAWCVQTVSLDDRRITGAVNKTKHTLLIFIILS